MHRIWVDYIMYASIKCHYLRRHPFLNAVAVVPSPRFLSIKRRDLHASPIEAAKGGGGGGGAKKNKKKGSNSGGSSQQQQQQRPPPGFSSFMFRIQYPNFDPAHPVYCGSPPEVVVPDAIRRLQRGGGGLDSGWVAQALTQGLVAILPLKQEKAKLPEGFRYGDIAGHPTIL